MKKLILIMAIGIGLSACTTLKNSQSKLNKMSPAEQALERQNNRE